MELLTALLLHHIVPGLAVHTPKPGSAPQRLVTALPGTEVTLAREGSAVWVGSAADRARVVAADLSAGKGLVHVIDRVLPPFDILRPPPDPPLPRPRTLREALVALGLPSTVGAMEEAAGLGPLLDQRGLAGTTGTLFAPNEEAWERMQDQLAPAEALLTSSKEAVKLAAAVQAEMPRLLPRLEPTLTLFAPTNDAFAALRAAEADAGDTDDAMMLVLSFHVHLGVTPVPLSSLSEGQLLLVGVEYKLYGEPGHKQLVVTVNASGAFVSLDHVTARVVGSLTYGGSVVNLIDRVLLTDALAARLLRRPPPPPPVDGAKGVPGAPEQPSAAGEGAPPPAPWPPQPGTPPGLDGPEVVFANQQYGNLTQALAGLGDTGTMLALYNAVAESVVGGILRGVLSGSFTLFCPTDQAFAAFLARTQRTLAEVLAVDKDPVAVARVVLPHILLYRAVPPEELTPGRNLTTGMVGVLQTQLTVARSGDRIAILGPGTSVVHVLRTGITSGAAQVHVIDGVIELKA
ncbi:hypothetical protein HYH03_001842 [Edaphochlamys debaryana]|uniref:FAS1 domain-containing protein n=1 Tax=Edaphochlamys debaryana TaxID=47281 RepID=A0A835YEG7_9CHLO|nr:hypothetical protein HYH03_001842 [Edaphochlamys debaryana]|eukprot:KAG2500264.1 hypothetical protein HYH03_001842 [Edaphochlamys debaryana]